MAKTILVPAIVLALWTLVVMLLMGYQRFGAVKKLPKEKLRELPRVGGRGQDLEKVLPTQANWAGHNYSNLLEQPQLFYFTVIVLALLGEGSGLSLMLAWGYTLLRMAHSIWQITVNTVPIRFALFLLSSACLIGLSIKALLSAIG